MERQKETHCPVHSDEHSMPLGSQRGCIARLKHEISPLLLQTSVGTLGHQLMALFWEAAEPSGGGVSLDRVGHGVGDVVGCESYDFTARVTSLCLLSASWLPTQCDQLPGTPAIFHHR